MSHIYSHKIPFGLFAVICYLFTAITGWGYGNSYAVYVVFSVAQALFAYPVFFSRRNRLNGTLKGLLIYVLFSSLFLGFINDDLKSAVMVNISLLMPVALSTLQLSYKRLSGQLAIASLVNLGVIYIICASFGALNLNSLAFMIFCGISIGMIWFKVAKGFKATALSCGYLMLGTSLLLVSESRNAGICIMICFAMLLLPVKLYKNALFYRTIYISVMLATIFATNFMIYILSDEEIMQYVLSFTSSFSQKEWGMDTHYILLQHVAENFAARDLFTQLFGTGVKIGHTHNLCYQCLTFYGYIGTTIIYAFYAYVYERAFKLIKNNGDILALSCCIVLTGHFLLQIGEVYMQGSETANMMSMLPVAVILQRWYSFRNTRRTAI